MNFDRLAQRIDGEVIDRRSPEYDQLPEPNNARFDQVQPLAVVLCKTSHDVAEAIGFIRRHGLRSATRCGGHCFAGRSSTTGILIDVSPMNSISLSNGVARVGAGAKLGQVYDRLLAHGLTIPGGTCPSVGIAGFVLGGGLGMLGRKHGLASDHLATAQIVLASGRDVECDEHHEEDLYWALRGAGSGNFGVVTQLIFRTMPVPSVATTFELSWPFSQTAQVVQAWLGWAGHAPDEIAASLDLRASRNPDESPSIEVFGTALTTRPKAAELLAELADRAEAGPTSSLLQEMSYLDTVQHWAGRASEGHEGPRLGPATRGYEVVKSEFFAQPLPAEAVAAIVNNLTAGRVIGQSREVDFSPWGGAYNRVGAKASAFVHRDALFWLKHTAVVAADAGIQEREAAHSWVNRSWMAVRPWGNGRVFPNFPDPDLEDWGRAYYGSNYERLVKLKARYDPDNFFRFNQSLPIRVGRGGPAEVRRIQ